KKHNVKTSESAFSKEEIAGDKLCLVLTDIQKADFTDFDGNAQGLRVLTKLQILSDAFGINLTYATLASYIKYPNYGTVNKEGPIEEKKRGVFQSEKEYFDKIVEECGLKVGDRVIRHPLCYIMEAADSICYLAMDVEDGFNKKLYGIDYLYSKYKDIPCLSKRISFIYNNGDGTFKNDITKVVHFRIAIIHELVLLAIRNFENNINQIESGTYNKELIWDDEENKLAKQLYAICEEKIFKYREITSLEITGHSVITGLLDYYTSFVFHKDKHYRKRAQSLISESLLKAAFEENKLPETSTLDELNDYYKLRVIVDFISGMTDQFALNHYQKISGQKIS
ncbi:MAG: dNTP triphosphohydrolase, partial [Alphaproteobacteria bacterium]